jgi:hypothetical protein
MCEKVQDPDGATAPQPADVLVVNQSLAQRNIGFGFILAVCVAAIVRGIPGATTTSGAVAVGVIFGAILLVFLRGWVRSLRHPSTIEVSKERIRYVSGPNERRADLIRDRGSALVIYVRLTGRFATMMLEQTATSVAWSLPYFTRKAITTACEARGWQVTYIGRGKPSATRTASA